MALARGNPPLQIKGAAPVSVNLMIDSRGWGAYVASMAREREDSPIDNWAVLRSFLTTGWEAMARQSGALRRARDFPDAQSLLRVLLLHVGEGCSLAETAARARQLGVTVSAVAVFKRLRASEQWLRWLAEQLRGQQRLPLPAQGRVVRLVDGTAVSPSLAARARIGAYITLSIWPICSAITLN